MTRSPFRPLGRTGILVPPIVFGATSLGNLFRAVSDDEKQAIMREWFACLTPPVVIDSAGKYGAGLSLEVIGRGLKQLGISPQDVLISNKLAWRRVPLCTAEPTFEPGAWVDIDHDAVQDIGYDGILRCWEEGNVFLGDYRASLVSVHDPDEYLAAACDPTDRDNRLHDIIEAYRALCELRDAGQAKAVGIGAKSWRTIELLSKYCDLDWVMFANSFTIMNHPRDLIDFMSNLSKRGVGIFNSALFHGGFLVGGDFFDYRRLDPSSPLDNQRLNWRERFWRLCKELDQTPLAVACGFGISHPAITAVALSTSRPTRVAEQVASVMNPLSPEIWSALIEQEMIDRDYPYASLDSECCDSTKN